MGLPYVIICFFCDAMGNMIYVHNIMAACAVVGIVSILLIGISPNMY